MRAMKSLEDKMERERDVMSEAALNFRESKEESGIRLAGFEKWCTTENDVIRLRILDWLKHIGNQWLERMSLSQAEREADSTPLPRSAFRVAKNPGLRAKFSKITQETFEKVFDKYAQHGQMSVSPATLIQLITIHPCHTHDHYHTAPCESCPPSPRCVQVAEFDRALANMGVTVPYLRERFFSVSRTARLFLHTAAFGIRFLQ